MNAPTPVTHIIVTEVGTRDGFQAEPIFIPTERKVEVINGLIDAGVQSFETTSFVSPRAVPQMADATDVMAQVQRKPLMTSTLRSVGMKTGSAWKPSRVPTSVTMMWVAGVGAFMGMSLRWVSNNFGLA